MVGTGLQFMEEVWESAIAKTFIAHLKSSRALCRGREKSSERKAVLMTDCRCLKFQVGSKLLRSRKCSEAKVGRCLEELYTRTLICIRVRSMPVCPLKCTWVKITWGSGSELWQTKLLLHFELGFLLVEAKARIQD